MISFQVDQLSFSYRNHPVLAGLDMTVHKGRLHALVGANGAGKSTLIRLLAGLLQPDLGKVNLEGKDLSSLKDKERAKQIAYMAQETMIPGNFTAGEVVAMGRYAYEKTPKAAFDEAVVQDAMNRTRTLPLFHQKIGELSGGEKSRVLLARALAQDTQVLLLDEVTAALDITHQLTVMENLREWMDEEKTVVMVLHDINLAARYVDEIWMLADGKVYAHGSPAEVLTRGNIEAVYDANCLIDWNILTNTPMIIPLERRKTAGEGMKVHVVCGGGSGSQLLSVLYSWGMNVTAGILNQGDSDQLTAKRLEMTVFSKEAFSSIEKDDVRNAWDKLDEIEAVLVTDMPIGSGNVSNIAFINMAADRGLPVLYCPWQNEPQYVHRDYEDEWERALDKTMRCQTRTHLKKQLEDISGSVPSSD